MPGSSLPPAEFWDDQMREHRIDDFYGGSGYFNFGLGPVTLPQREACDALVDVLLSFISGAPRTIADVACGNGATTRQIGRRFPGSLVVGLNISPTQLARARQSAPGSTLVCGDATALPMATGSVDVVVAVEAAFSFRPRTAFLAEAARVLAPGGRLVLSDVLTTDVAVRYAPQYPPANYLATPDAYRALVQEYGFTDVEIDDVKPRVWDSFVARKRAFNDRLLAAADVTREEHTRRVQKLALWDRHLTYYVLLSAIRR